MGAHLMRVITMGAMCAIILVVMYCVLVLPFYIYKKYKEQIK